MVSASCPETPSSCSWCRSQCCPSSGTRRRRTRRCRRSGGRWARPPSPRSPSLSPPSCSCPCPGSTRPALGGFLLSSSRSEKLGHRGLWSLVPPPRLTSGVSELWNRAAPFLKPGRPLYLQPVIDGWPLRCVLGFTNMGVSHIFTPTVSTYLGNLAQNLTKNIQFLSSWAALRTRPPNNTAIEQCLF